MSRGRKWFFRLLAGIALPLLLLAILEISLRLGGYGYPTGFFKPMRIDGQDCLVENDSFGFRFFPPAIARTPASIRLPVQKPLGTCRIFIFGESAALGDPEPAFGAGRYLEMLLRERYPQAKFEVVNVAMTAINSHAIWPIAQDCASRDGDLWIIYLGNNEMVGPFGAATVFGAQAPPWPLVRFNLALQQLRLGQLLADLGQKLHAKKSGATPWSGMNMFTGNTVAPDDSRREVVDRNFQKNLHDIISTGLKSGAHVLLSTVAVNLQDCSPFASTLSPHLATGDSNRVVQLLNEGNTLARNGNDAEAVTRYEQAASLHPQSADLEFHWGRSLLALNEPAAARPHFQNAVDFDALPFRADSHINGLITDAAAEFAGPRLSFVDASSALENKSSNSIPGLDNFYEHVHLNFDGNYRLALAWANQIAPALPANFATRSADNWASQETCEQNLGLTTWDRYNVLKEVSRRLQQPPLSRQFNHTDQLQLLSAQMDQLHDHMTAYAVAPARDIYRRALEKSPDDYYILENFANFLGDQGDYAGASEQWQKVRRLMPQDHAAYYELGRLAGLQGKFDEAKSLLNQALAIHPSFAPGWYELGKAEAAAGHYEPALKDFNQALKFEPQDAPSWFDGGLALAMLDRRAEAIQYYRQATKYAPDDWRAHYELGGLLGQDGKMAEARDESAIAVRLNPKFSTTHLNLGMALVQLGQLDEAEQQFEQALQLDPNNSKAADYLQQTRNLKQKKP